VKLQASAARPMTRTASNSSRNLFMCAAPKI
jgi:hypothetical protein